MNETNIAITRMLQAKPIKCICQPYILYRLSFTEKANDLILGDVSSISGKLDFAYVPTVSSAPYWSALL